MSKDLIVRPLSQSFQQALSPMRLSIHEYTRHSASTILMTAAAVQGILLIIIHHIGIARCHGGRAHHRSLTGKDVGSHEFLRRT